MLSCEPMSLKDGRDRGGDGADRLSVLSCEPMSLKVRRGHAVGVFTEIFQCSPVSRCR